MKNFKLNPLALKDKAVKLFLSSGLIIASSIGLTGCSGNTDKSKDPKLPTEDVVESVEPEKTQEELEAESLQDFQIVPDGKTYNNEILERYNKTQAYCYIINPGRDQVEIIELISPTEEGIAELQKNGNVYQYTGSVIVPCCFVYFTNNNGWVKTYPNRMNVIDQDRYVAADKKYKYISDDELDKRFENKEPGENYQLGDEYDSQKSKDKVAMVYKIEQKVRI